MRRRKTARIPATALPCTKKIIMPNKDRWMMIGNIQ